MYLRAAQGAALAFNILGTLAPVAAAAQFWSDKQVLTWLSFGVFAIILLFGHNVPILGIGGMLAGWGLMAYAAMDDATTALVAGVVAGLVYYLIAWQVHRAKEVVGRDLDSASP
jgi:hypothetical protein